MQIAFNLVFAILSYFGLTFDTEVIAWVGKTQWRNFLSCQVIGYWVHDLHDTEVWEDEHVDKHIAGPTLVTSSTDVNLRGETITIASDVCLCWRDVCVTVT